MQLVLSSENVVDFLTKHRICSPDFCSDASIVREEGTNFNLVVDVDGRNLLVKQNRIGSKGITIGNLFTEWLVQALINAFKLTSIQSLVSQVLLWDESSCILVAVFYDNHIALNQLYATSQNFAPQIANTMGMNLAQIHRATYQQEQHREFLSRYTNPNEIGELPIFIRKLNSLDPSIFATVCPDGLEFYKLYQRFPSFNHSVLELYAHIQPSCLIHNDLTLDNFIMDRQLDVDSSSVEPEQIKIIDWERAKWGDPAVDLGMVIAEYVGGIWLESLIVDRDLDINTILRLATVPLEAIMPSLKAFIQGYLTKFPQIIVHRPDFIRRVVQFAGIGILDRLSYYVEHHYHFQNNSLCKLQVAKNLVCSPQQSIGTIFGTTEAELMEYSSFAA